MLLICRQKHLGIYEYSSNVTDKTLKGVMAMGVVTSRFAALMMTMMMTMTMTIMMMMMMMVMMMMMIMMMMMMIYSIDSIYCQEV